MFVALRELVFAKGRFGLIALVVALITLLTTFLASLTGGLAAQNISAVLGLGDANGTNASQIVLAKPADGSAATYASSQLSQDDVAIIEGREGVTAVTPVGISQTRATTSADRDASSATIAIFAGDTAANADARPSGDGRLTLPQTAAKDLGVATGDSVLVQGVSFSVERVVPDEWYSHTPVARMTLSDWHTLGERTGSTAFASVAAISTDSSFDAAALADGTSLQATSVLGSLTALSTFRSEIGSLLLMVSMLFGISALVVGAFFTVWSLQRTPDVAVLKALGASTGSLVRDSIGQALIVLLIGVGAGLAATLGLGAALGSALPISISWLTTVLPAVLLVVLGLAGALFALRSVVKADPITALGATR